MEVIDMPHKNLEPFDRKQTDWHGLWWHPDQCGYTSSVIDLSTLRKFKGKVRLYVRKNMYYIKGSSRPNYNFCIKDAESDTFEETQIKDDERCAEWVWEERNGWTIGLDPFTNYFGWWCSKCDEPNGEKNSKFCPHCGRKMINGE